MIRDLLVSNAPGAQQEVTRPGTLLHSDLGFHGEVGVGRVRDVVAELMASPVMFSIAGL